MGYYDEALAHHGIKGQKWGVRRFQDYQGHRIGGKKTSGATKSNPSTKSKKSKHEFQDTSESDTSARKDMVKVTLGAWGGTALTAAATAASVAVGNPVLAATITGYGLLPSSTLAILSTGGLIAGDINASKANKKEKKFAEERAQNPIDKKTGFHKKTTEMTPEEDMERVNPAYKNWDANTKSNCVLCTMSMELRRRGYDVQAKKATSGYDANTLVKDWFTGSKPKEAEGSLSDSEVINNALYGRMMNGKQKKQMIDNAINEIEKQPKGSRGMMTVTWDGTTSGHAISYANEDGKMVLYDTQSNQKYSSNLEIMSFLSRCSQITTTRLDKCQINNKYIKEVAE